MPFSSRQKRGLYPGNAEYEFFDNYFRDSGRGNECFLNSICHGRISDWRQVFDVGHHVDYRGAMDRVRQFYVNEKYRGKVAHRVGGNRKRNQQSTNADQKSIETVFLIAICRQWGDKWQSKTLFLLVLICVLR